jgi:hypothetical protein
MSPLYTFNGLILRVANALAAGPSCCCNGDGECCATDKSVTFRLHDQTFTQNLPINAFTIGDGMNIKSWYLVSSCASGVWTFTLASDCFFDFTLNDFCTPMTAGELSEDENCELPLGIISMTAIEECPGWNPSWTPAPFPEVEIISFN